MSRTLERPLAAKSTISDAMQFGWALYRFVTAPMRPYGKRLTDQNCKDYFRLRMMDTLYLFQT